MSGIIIPNEFSRHRVRCGTLSEWWPPMLDRLPLEVLVLVCRKQRDSQVFLVLARANCALRESIHKSAFLQQRAHLARNGIGWAQLLGISYAIPIPPVPLRPYPPQLTALHHYLRQTKCIDWAAGREGALLTLDTQVQISGVHLFSQMPDACLGIFHNDATFVYDAGPRPCPWMLQIFRAGAPEGRHYGMRSLEYIPKGSFVCVFWGNYEREYGSNTYFLGVTPKGEPPFVIDPTRRGNLARWINHSQTHPNLTPCLSRCADTTPDRMLVELYARRDIAAGEELLWDYWSVVHEGSFAASRFFKAPFPPGPGWPTDGAPWPDDARADGMSDEMLRTEGGECLAAVWAPCMPRLGEGDQPDERLGGHEWGLLQAAVEGLDVLAAQGLPPGPGSSREERRLSECPGVASLHAMAPLPRRWGSRDSAEMAFARGWFGEWWPEHDVVRD